MNAAPLLVLLTVLQQSSTVEEVSSGDSSTSYYRLALEAGALSFPSGTQGGGQDLFAQALPIARLEVGENFSLELGAPLRMRLLDEEPAQLADDYSAHLRREDWDTPSDFGQILRHLYIGRDDGKFSLHAGALTAFTLGEGHLVERYNNQLSPDYHPAGAVLTLNLGPARVQAVASDVLSPRLFASELRLDIGRLASTEDKHFDRYHGIAAVAHDFGRVGGEASSDSLTAALLGADAALYKSKGLQVFALAGAGSRVDVGTPDLGGFLGLAVRGTTETERVDVSGRLEGRYQGGSFRFGLFGPAYELARFSATGLSEPPLSEERLERHMSGYGELKLGLGGSPEELSLSASAAGEYFAFGRVDADLSLGFTLPGGRTIATARVILTGLGAQPRYSAQAELRQRILPWLYAWGAGGTVHFPQPDGSLARGFTAGAGAGVDFER